MSNSVPPGQTRNQPYWETRPSRDPLQALAPAPKSHLSPEIGEGPQPSHVEGGLSLFLYLGAVLLA